MGTVEENLKVWDQTYNWHEGGDEWSEAWGGVFAQLTALEPQDVAEGSPQVEATV